MSASIPVLPLQPDGTIPQLGLGTWKSDPGVVYEAVREAIRIGYRHLDCAYAYDNEAEIGQALADAIAAGEVTRSELFITSKLWNAYHHPESVGPILAESLKRLQLDYLDLYLMHWPIAFEKGVGFPKAGEEFVSLEALPLIDTWRAMEACVDAGQAWHIGVSNFSVKKIKSLLAEARITPCNNQVEMHPYLQQEALVAFCHQAGIQVTAYSPLGSADRPEFLKSQNEPALLSHPEILAIAEAHSASPAQVVLAWNLARGVVVIPKSANPQRLAENFAAAKLTLSGEEMATLAKLDKHFRFIDGHFWEMAGSPYTRENLWDE
ncbi:aldo/keto reductase [Ferrimonas marina]|uniref:Alcohol dehydrogenase (NADP+) n=1 Tax=Ferrimonas marina TaxID=299255 RepID=A0A1M5Z617_9GAMM|nr:aldo/keto reductase [Ferrimonas marina]SHI19631.1 alcohol dehydrogenase (NADP+) [Ferrimonas marina]